MHESERWDVDYIKNFDIVCYDTDSSAAYMKSASNGTALDVWSLRNIWKEVFVAILRDCPGIHLMGSEVNHEKPQDSR
jgi:hypothetical protein